MKEFLFDKFIGICYTGNARKWEGTVYR